MLFRGDESRDGGWWFSSCCLEGMSLEMVGGGSANYDV